jgi:hypothetical protein
MAESMRGVAGRVNAGSGKGVVAMLARLQRAKLKRSDGDTDQPERWVAHRGCHPPDLAISTLAYRQAQPGVADGFALAYWWVALPYIGWWDGVGFCGPGHAVLKLNACRELFAGSRINVTFDLNPVGLPLLVIRVRNALLGFAILGEHQKTFRVVVEPARRSKARCAEEVGKRRPGMFRLLAIRELAQHAKWFVEQYHLTHSPSVQYLMLKCVHRPDAHQRSR